jgi:hypothetical protein
MYAAQAGRDEGRQGEARPRTEKQIKTHSGTSRNSRLVFHTLITIYTIGVVRFCLRTLSLTHSFLVSVRSLFWPLSLIVFLDKESWRLFLSSINHYQDIFVIHVELELFI